MSWLGILSAPMQRVDTHYKATDEYMHMILELFAVKVMERWSEGYKWENTFWQKFTWFLRIQIVSDKLTKHYL